MALNRSESDTIVLNALSIVGGARRIPGFVRLCQNRSEPFDMAQGERVGVHFERSDPVRGDLELTQLLPGRMRVFGRALNRRK